MAQDENAWHRNTVRWKRKLTLESLCGKMRQLLLTEFFCCYCCATSSSPPEQIQQQFAVCIISDDCVNGSVSRWFLLRLMPLLCCSVSFFTPLIFQIAVGESRTVNKQTNGQTSAHTPFIHNECTKWISGAQMNSMVELQTECMYALNMNINKHLPNGWLSTHSALDYTVLQ